MSAMAHSRTTVTGVGPNTHNPIMVIPQVQIRAPRAEGIAFAHQAKSATGIWRKNDGYFQSRQAPKKRFSKPPPARSTSPTEANHGSPNVGCRRCAL